MMYHKVTHYDSQWQPSFNCSRYCEYFAKHSPKRLQIGDQEWGEHVLWQPAVGMEMGGEEEGIE